MWQRIKSFETPELDTIIAKYSPFIREIRRRLIVTGVIFVLATICGFVFYENTIRFLVSILSLQGVNIVFTSPFQFINLAVSCGLATGIISIIPLFLWQLLSFIRPALNRKEFRLLSRFMPFCIFLFMFGFVFGIFIMKWQIEIFLQQSLSLGIGNILDISNLLTSVLFTATFMGVIFQFPIILFVSLRIGLVTHQQVASKRRWVYLIAFIIILFLPFDSVLADIALVIPVVLMFEATLFYSRIFNRASKRI